MNELPRLSDDGLITPEVGGWAVDKYRHVRNYAEMFATAMKAKWESRVYIDLFAGAGRSKMQGSGVIVPASSMLALGIPDPFDKYIFCDSDRAKLSALIERVEREYPRLDVAFLERDVNASVDEVLDKIPGHRPGFRVLTFCFADPYSLKNLRFATVRRLTERYADLLVLIPSGMDANRNQTHYEQPGNTTVDDFLGTNVWRAAWRRASPAGIRFGDFVADRFGQEMKALGYRYGGLEEATVIRSTDKNLPLYHLMLFSRHKLGEKFWRDVRKYSRDQLDLPFGGG